MERLLFLVTAAYRRQAAIPAHSLHSFLWRLLLVYIRPHP